MANACHYMFPVHVKPMECTTPSFRPFVTTCTVAYQAPLSVGFPRQEYWSGLPFLFPEDLPDPGIEPTSPAFAGKLFTTEAPGKPTTPRVNHNVNCGLQVIVMYQFRFINFCMCKKLQCKKQLHHCYTRC